MPPKPLPVLQQQQQQQQLQQQQQQHQQQPTIAISQPNQQNLVPDIIKVRCFLSK